MLGRKSLRLIWSQCLAKDYDMFDACVATYLSLYIHIHRMYACHRNVCAISCIYTIYVYKSLHYCVWDILIPYCTELDPVGSYSGQSCPVLTEIQHLTTEMCQGHHARGSTWVMTNCLGIYIYICIYMYPCPLGRLQRGAWMGKAMLYETWNLNC